MRRLFVVSDRSGCSISVAREYAVLVQGSSLSLRLPFFKQPTIIMACIFYGKHVLWIFLCGFMFGLVSTTISFTDFADLILKLHNLALKKPFADPSQGNHGKDAKKNIDICLSSHSATKKSLSRTKSPICFAKSERSNSKGAGGVFFCFFF